ncbi:MAG: B12-binding domain-containing radical SAM protein [Deltaproteobacteria bacterium]|nr:B12-binding domain-containing radical SAM protein [Deltaproteobacteria bacterium]
MKKIRFIEPKSPDVHVFTRAAIPRLGTVLLGTTLQEAGYDVKCYVEEVADMDLEDVLTADAVGISCITSTSMRSYEIAKLLKSTGIPVFMGGPHVTFLPDEALKYCDYVLKGECDDLILDFMKALETGEGLDDIPGLSYRDKNGEIHHNNAPTFCKDMDTIPAPDFTLVKGLECGGFKKFAVTPVMTSRGCPYDCSFCSVTSMFGQKYRFRSTDNVMNELRRNKEGGGKWVFFYDDNFTADRKRTKVLLQRMIDEKITPNWTAQIRVETAKDTELLDLMRRSGCHTVYIGFESVNPKTLELYNKKQSVEDIQNCIRILHDNKIRIHGMFVFGSDEDDIETIHQTVTFAKKNNLESVQFLILTPLPGTKMHDDLASQNRIVSRDWSLYDAHHVVYEPKHMTYYELQHETLKASRQFYSIGQIVKQAFQFDTFSVVIKAYGRRMTNHWIHKNQYFIDYTRSLTKAGKAIELAAKKTAEDVKEQFRKLEISGHVHVQPGSKKS